MRTLVIPTQAEVDKSIYSAAAQMLDGKPVGSTIMVTGCIGYKKMSFWWNVRVWGIVAALRQTWKDYCA